MKKVGIVLAGFLLVACHSYKVPMVPTYQQIPVIQVKKDDTLYSLARRYDTTVQQLIEKNDIADPTALQVGQDLKLPKSVRVATYELEKEEKTLQSTKNKQSSKRALSQSKSTGNTSKKKALMSKIDANDKRVKSNKKKPKSTQQMVKLDKPFVATGKVNFEWPLKGKIISSFGSKGNGVKNDGINIAAAKGAAIKAAEAGVVVYAGNELKGYGNLLLLRHEKNFMSAYAHADKLYVKVGDVVAKGDKIATVGNSGNVKVSQLHFEIRKKTKSVDPKKYLQ
ncbi:MAG: M23 family metallopeptidase [Alphaproteobacteria bacterium]|nr:M23 family metallopeptidase [Alphaproteobacteria bacterium]